MTTVTTASSPSFGRATPAAKVAAKAGTPAQTAGAAVTVDVGAAARRQLAALVSSAPASRTDATDDKAVKSFDDMVAGRTRALSETLSDRFTRLGIPLDEPITLKLDSLGKVTTDSPYKKKIEKLFEDDPELARSFKDVASLNSIRAAQKALDAFQEARRAAKDNEAREAAQGLYTARMMQSQTLSGTMTLAGGELRSASIDVMAKSLGESEPPKASTKAEQVPGHRVSLTV